MSRTNSYSSFLHFGISLPDSHTGDSMRTNYDTKAVDCSVSPCDRHMGSADIANPAIRNHFRDSGKEVYCCKSTCGQVENMAVCAIVYKDNCNKQLNDCGAGGKLVCTMASNSYVEPPLSEVPPIKSYIKYPTVFQKPGNTESHDCHTTGSRTPTPWQTTLYDVNSFLNGAVLTNLNSIVSNKDGQPNYDEIMALRCSSQAQYGCPPDPITGAPQKTCPLLFSTSDDADVCRSWYTKLTANDGGAPRGPRTQGYHDMMASLYCDAYPDDSACSCYSRGTNANYQQTKPYFPMNDGCWYGPCLPDKEKTIFLPSDVRIGYRTASAQGSSAMCPSVICSNYINAGGDVNATNSSLYISCNQDS